MEELYSDAKDSSDNSADDSYMRRNGSSRGCSQIKFACTKVTSDPHSIFFAITIDTWNHIYMKSVSLVCRRSLIMKKYYTRNILI